MFIYTSLATKLRTFMGIAVLLLLLATTGLSLSSAEQTRAPISSPAAPAAIAAASYGQLPLSFVPNAGTVRCGRALSGARHGRHVVF